MSSRFYDFFDVTSNGALPETREITWSVTSADRNADPEIEATGSATFGDSFIEDFEHGWNKETTYDLYRKRIDALFVVAEGYDPLSPAFQASVCAAIIFTISGLETLVRTAAKLDRNASLRQEIGEFVRAVDKRPGYRPLDERDRAPLARLFEARHAIVHEGWRWTSGLRNTNDRRSPNTTELLFDLDGVRRIVAAADRFAACIAPCCECLDLGEEDTNTHSNP